MTTHILIFRDGQMILFTRYHFIYEWKRNEMTLLTNYQYYLINQLNIVNVILFTSEHWQCDTVHKWTLTTWYCSQMNIDNVILFTREHWQCDTVHKRTLTTWYCSQVNIDNVILFTREHWQHDTVHKRTLTMWYCSQQVEWG
jgi:hypothetical protein